MAAPSVSSQVVCFLTVERDFVRVLDEQDLENARLFAAAPRLRAVLTDLIEWAPRLARRRRRVGRRHARLHHPADTRVRRFACRSRCEYIVTNRKRFAAARWQQRQRDCLPLLGLRIAETQPSIDDVMDRREQCWVVTEQANRDRRAGQWRKARRDIEDRERKVQRALLTYWNQHRWLPGDLSYLLDMLHGKLAMPPIEEMLTMAPLWRARMPDSTARVMATRPKKSASNMARTSRSSPSSIAAR